MSKVRSVKIARRAIKGADRGFNNSLSDLPMEKSSLIIRRLFFSSTRSRNANEMSSIRRKRRAIAMEEQEDKKSKNQKAKSLFEMRKNLENFELHSVTEIAKAVEKFKYQQVHQYQNKYHDIFEREWSMMKKLQHVDVKEFCTAPIGVGDVVQVCKIESSDTELASDLALLVGAPLFLEDDGKYTLLTRRGELRLVSRSEIQFRVPKVVSPIFIDKCLLKKNTVIAMPEHDPFSQEEITSGWQVADRPRQVVFFKLHQFMDKAWKLLPGILPKLHLVNCALKNLEVDRISAVQLYNVIHNLKGDSFESTSDIITKFMCLSSESSRPGPLKLSEKSESLPQSLDISHLFALHMALIKQRSIWVYNSDSISHNTKSFLTIQPRSSPVNQTSSRYLTKVIDYINKKLSGNALIVPQQYNEVMQLVFNYCAGNLTDQIQISRVTELLKRVKIFADEQIVTATHAFYLLRKLKYPLQGNSPSNWSDSITVFGLSGGSGEQENRYYEAVGRDSLQEKDPLQGLRRDFGTLPVYCIDSETAHEIDDGVSIERVSDSQWNIHVHIADPASYIDFDSTIAKIARKRASSLYLTDTHVPMLPPIVSQVAGLGTNDSTRTMVYSVSYNPKTKKFLYDERKSLFEDGVVTGGIAHKFVQVSYDQVNAILKDSQYKYHQDLQDLLEVSERLRALRRKDGALIFKNSRSVVQIDSEGCIKMEHSDETASQIMVSELMILANRVAGDFFASNKIPGLYRNLANSIVEAHDDKYHSISESLNKLKARIDVDLRDFDNIIGLWNASYYDTKATAHEFLAVKRYNPSSSPLRRYGDLVSHWQTHDFLRNRKVTLTTETLNSIIPGLQSQTQVIKRASRRSENYWKMLHIIQKLNGGDPFDSLVSVNYKSPQNKFKFVIMPGNSGKSESVTGYLEGYRIIAHMKLDIYEKSPSYGEVIAVKITRIDPVDLTLKVEKLASTA